MFFSQVCDHVGILILSLSLILDGTCICNIYIVKNIWNMILTYRYSAAVSENKKTC